MGSRANDTGKPALCSSCIDIQKSSKSPGPGSIEHTAASGAFRKMGLAAGSKSHEEVEKQLAVGNPEGTPTDDVVTHASLHVLANYNLGLERSDLRLHRLYRDLSLINLEGPTISKIVELLLFTYDNTAIHESEAGSDGKNQMLRRVLTAFATGL